MWGICQADNHTDETAFERFCSCGLTRVSTYLNISNEFRSERSCLAFSLPKSEAKTRKWASRTASLARDTVQEKKSTRLAECTGIPYIPLWLPGMSHWANQNLNRTHLALKTGSSAQRSKPESEPTSLLKPAAGLFLCPATKPVSR